MSFDHNFKIWPDLIGQLEAETRPSLKKIRKDTNLGDSIKILVDMMTRSKTWLQLIY